MKIKQRIFLIVSLMAGMLLTFHIKAENYNSGLDLKNEPSEEILNEDVISSDAISFNTTKSELMMQDEIPSTILDALEYKGLNYWRFVSYERVIMADCDTFVHDKIIFSGEDKVHILYFNEYEELITDYLLPKGPGVLSM